MQKRVDFFVGSEKLVGDLHLTPPPGNRSGSLPERSGESLPCVITSHGFGSNRKKGKWPQIAQRFSSEGIAVFNFGGLSVFLYPKTLLGSQDENPACRHFFGRHLFTGAFF